MREDGKGRREGGRGADDIHDVPISTEIFRKLARRGNDDRKFRLSLHRIDRLPQYYAGNVKHFSNKNNITSKRVIAKIISLFHILKSNAQN